MNIHKGRINRPIPKTRKAKVTFTRCGTARTPQVVDNMYWNFTRHQQQRIEEIQGGAGFDYWDCSNYAEIQRASPRPVPVGTQTLKWYDTTGRLHVLKVGKTKDESEELII